MRVSSTVEAEVRYHFNFSNGTHNLLDIEGAIFPTLGAAMEEGRLSARELLSLDHGKPDPTYAGGRYSITDEAGTVIGVILFDEAALG
jgi:hypothetical protein